MEMISCKMGDVVALEQGLAINKKSKHLVVDEGLPLLRITDMFSQSFNQFINSDEVPEKFIARDDDLIYSRTGQVGHVFRNQKGVIHNNCFRINPIDGVDRGFMYWFLKQEHVRDHANTLASGAAQPDLNHDAFKSLDFLYPSNIVEQKSIVDMLDQYDNLIENNNRRIAILEDIAQTLYREWFVKFRYPGHQNQKLKNSPLGKIPEGCEVKPAKEIFNINIGKTPPRKQSQWFSSEGNGVKWISIKDMGNSQNYVLDTNECLVGEAIDKFNVKVIPGNTVVMSFKLTVGKVAITTEDMCTNEAIAHFNIKNSDEISKEYIYLYLSNFDFQTLGNTSSIGNAINSQIVKSMPVVLPDTNLVDEFNKICFPIFKQLLTLVKANKNLRKQRDMLLPKLISGTISIRGY